MVYTDYTLVIFFVIEATIDMEDRITSQLNQSTPDFNHCTLQQNLSSSYSIRTSLMTAFHVLLC